MSIRLQDPSLIEQRLLELAHTTDAKLTAAALAYFAPCSLDAAARVLESLATRDRLTMEVEDDGAIVYQMPGRQQLAPRAPALRPEIMRAPPPPLRGASPAVAAVLSLLIPGAGQLYAGRVAAAFLWFFAVGLGYALILPGLILHLFCIASAARAARERDAGGPHLLAPGRA